MKYYVGTGIWSNSLERPKQRKMGHGMFGISIAALETVASEFAKYNLDLVAVPEVTWIGGGSQPAQG